ncbi:MAG: muramidase [Firmicutes bacterium HGW-Firmicutes-15]|nr:MAG: muramidase [Firmicutes bacterium HGW-Firmicutes-15]
MKIDNSLISPDAIKSQYTVSNDKTSSDKFTRELESAVSKQDKQKLMASCQELESVFLNKIMECMRATIPKSDLVEKSFATETFESMLDEEYSKQMSKTGSIGLADILYKQLSNKL